MNKQKYSKLFVSLTAASLLATSCAKPQNENTTTPAKPVDNTEKKEVEVKKVSEELTKKASELIQKLEKLEAKTEEQKKEKEELLKNSKILITSTDEKILKVVLSNLEKDIEDLIKKWNTVTPTANVQEKVVYQYSNPRVINRVVVQEKEKVVEKVKEITKQEEKQKEVPKLPVEENKEISEKIEAIMSTWIKNNNIPGGVVLVAKDGKIVSHKAYGNQMIAEFDTSSTYDKPNYISLTNPIKAKEDTMYDLASVTKIMSTTQAIMKLVSEKKVDLNDKVEKYLPGFKANGKENVTVKSLLTHTSGLPQWEPTYFYGKDKKTQLNFLKNVALNPKFVEDGVNNKMHHYSDLGFMTLGYIVESVSGKSLDEYVLSEIYTPLGLKQTLYNPKTKFGINNIAATSLGNPYEYKMVDEENYPNFGYDTTKDQALFKTFDGWRKYVLRGEVNDGNAAMATNGVAGHAGLFSTANDLAVLTQLMLNKGEYEGVRIYNADVVDLFTSKQTNTGIISEEFGYGFKLDQSWMGDSASEKVYGHDGFTGTYFVNDPDNKLTIIVLTNKMQSGFRSGLLSNGRPQNPNLYWNIAPMVRAISNSVRDYYNIK